MRGERQREILLRTGKEAHEMMLTRTTALATSPTRLTVPTFLAAHEVRNALKRSLIALPLLVAETAVLWAIVTPRHAHRRSAPTGGRE